MVFTIEPASASVVQRVVGDPTLVSRALESIRSHCTAKATARFTREEDMKTIFDSCVANMAGALQVEMDDMDAEVVNDLKSSVEVLTRAGFARDVAAPIMGLFQRRSAGCP